MAQHDDDLPGDFRDEEKILDDGEEVIDDGEDFDLDDVWADGEDDEEEDEEEDDALAEVRHAEENLEPWVPQAGEATDPFADQPEARQRALAPLLDRGGRNLTWSSLRFLRGTGDEKLDLILSLPDPARAVQAMAPEEFVLLIKEIGLTDAGDLLALASPRQLQTTLDLDAWLAGELDTMAVSEWLMTAEDAGKDVVDRFTAAQDDGLLSFYLSQSLNVVILTEDDMEGDYPDDAEVFTSPDGAFQLIANADDPNLTAVRQVLASVWRQSAARGRALLLATRWELPAQLEEDVLQLRNARLEEIGFLDREEALQLYGYRDAHAWKAALHARYRGTAAAEPETLQPYLPEDVPVRLGLALREVRDTGFLGRVMAHLPEAEVVRMRLGLVRLGYAVQSARAERPSAVDELSRWSRHALMTASMALEFLSDADVTYAGLLLTVASLKDLFTAGHSLVLVEAQRARKLRQQLGGSTGIDRLEPADAQLVRGLTLAFPQYGRDNLSEPVATLDELAAIRHQLAAVVAVVRMAQTLSGGDLPSTAPVPLRALVGTAIAWQLVTGVPQLAPLDRATFQAFLQRGFDGPRGNRVVRNDLRQALIRALLTRPDLGDDDVVALTAFLETTLDRLADELGGLDPESPIDLRYVGEGLRVATPD